DRSAHRREGVQLDHDHVEGVALVRAADAVRPRIPVPVHDRWILWTHARDRARRLPVPGYLLRGRALPLRAGARRGIRHHGWRVLLVTEVDRPHVRLEARRLALLAVGDLRQRAVLPAAFPRA